MTRSKLEPQSDPPHRLAKLGESLAARPYARRGAPMSEDTIRIILVDDHAMFREGLHVLLRGAPDIAVVGEAEDGAAGAMLARRLEPDVVILDLDMPRGDGLWALRAITDTAPAVRVLVLTVHAEQERLLQLLEAGARGYLTKDAASRELVEAIRVVAGGDIYVRPTVARLLAAAVVPQRIVATATGRFNTLSEREQTILRMVAQGFSGAEVARHLGISSKTVAAYKHRIQEKLGIEHRTDYVRFALEAGVLAR
jgi:DNA-binding NarL/FixJ family response regulator